MTHENTDAHVDRLVAHVQRELRAAADPAKAPHMAAYMKTDMPFYGVQKPQRERILASACAATPLDTRQQVRSAIEALWKLPHREEKYLAVSLARRFERFIAMPMLPLYKRMIRQGAWWDFVDEIASRLVGRLLLDHRDRMTTELDRWLTHNDMWVRRSAIISQLTHKEHTDEKQLWRYCLACADEQEFFIRKAIGWALRQYAHTNPNAVRGFLDRHGSKLSTLSTREASKHL